ncbi:MAG: hypothetical protein SOR23_00555, partial [Candidatus Enterosoma sp.]|nr:hypothetical protein [Candidatus Enterosoma sp.]
FGLLPAFLLPLLFDYLVWRFKLDGYWNFIFFVIYMGYLLLVNYIGIKHYMKWTDNDFLRIKKLFFVQKVKAESMEKALTDAHLVPIGKKGDMWWKKKNYLISRGTVCFITAEKELTDKEMTRKVNRCEPLKKMNCVVLIPVYEKDETSQEDIDNLLKEALKQYRFPLHSGIWLLPALRNKTTGEMYYVDIKRKFGIDVYYIGFHFLRKHFEKA